MMLEHTHPICDVCGKPVARFTTWEDRHLGKFYFLAECHGQRERVEVELVLLEQAPDLSLRAGRAFVGPKRLSP